MGQGPTKSSKAGSTCQTDETNPAQCEKVIIDGFARTRYKAVEQIFRELFKVKTLDELESLSVAVKKQLEDLGCFKSTDVNLNFGKLPQSYQVKYVVEETPRISAGMKTCLGNNEASVLFGLWFPNLTGNADTFWSELRFNSDKTVNNKLSYKRPLPRYRYNPNLNVTLFFQNQDVSDLGFHINEGGLSLGVDFQLFQHFKHFITWEGSIRNQIGRGDMSITTRENCGYSMKSSIKHTALLDDRNSNLFPTKGHLIKFTTEAAGLGGNIAFVKNNLIVQHNYTLPCDIVLQTSFGMGLLNSMSCGSKYLDQFMLGGPLSMRGFHTNGISLKNECITSYWIGNIHLYFPFEIKPLKNYNPEAMSNYYAHIFINSGNVGGGNDSLKKDLMNLGQGCRISCGLGLVVILQALGRVELNYCLPIRQQTEDKSVSGLQFGVGFDFL